MLQAGPHIHGDGPQLDLHRQVQRPLGDDDGHVADQVQAPIAGFLGLLDIVDLPDDLEILVPGQQTAQVTDIVQIVADDPHPGHVLDMGIDVVDGDLEPPALQLFHDAVHGFDAVLDVVDGGVVIQAGKLLVQDLQLGDGNLQGAAVQVVHPHHALGQLLLFRRTPLGDMDVLEPDGAAFFDHHEKTAPPRYWFSYCYDYNIRL